MTPKKEIVDAKADGDGDITHVKFKRNQRWTSVERAIPMAERDEIKNTHVVHPTDGRKDHLRTDRDGKQENNLDDMAGDT